MRSPFINTIVVIAIHGDNVLGDISTGSYPALDRVCSEGVTTGLMLSKKKQLCSYSLGPFLEKQAICKAEENKSQIHALHPTEVRKKFELDAAPPPGVYIIDASADLSTANKLTQYLTPHFTTRTRVQSPARKSNEHVQYTAPLAVMIMASGHGDWTKLLPSPCTKFNDCLPTPRQTCCVEENASLSLQGLCCIAGSGLTRCDDRDYLARCGIAPGDGYLRLDQIAAELLSKAALVEKYGA